jgi:hypothetical protein
LILYGLLGQVGGDATRRCELPADTVAALQRLLGVNLKRSSTTALGTGTNTNESAANRAAAPSAAGHARRISRPSRMATPAPPADKPSGPPRQCLRNRAA